MSSNKQISRGPKMPSQLAIATFFCLLSIGCHSNGPNEPSAAKTTVLQVLSNGPESLVGEYGVPGKGATSPFIRISHPDSSGPFVIEEFTLNKWKVDKETGRPLTREEFSKLVGAGIDVPFAGLVLGQTALIKVPEGWQHGKLQTKTGYFFFSGIGPIELTRM